MRETRMYSLYEKQNGKWVRVAIANYKKSVAVRLFQGYLLEGALGGKPERCLRPIKEGEKIGTFLRGED